MVTTVKVKTEPIKRLYFLSQGQASFEISCAFSSVVRFALEVGDEDMERRSFNSLFGMKPRLTALCIDTRNIAEVPLKTYFVNYIFVTCALFFGCCVHDIFFSEIKEERLLQSGSFTA